MTFRIIIEPTAEREIRSTVRWKSEYASPTVAARAACHEVEIFQGVITLMPLNRRKSAAL